MTTFQLICAAAFFGLLAVAYGKDIYVQVQPFLAGFLPKPATPDVSQGVAEQTVRDLVTVAELRDRLDAEGCKDGVEACSILLKIIIDHKHPHTR